MNHPSSAGHAPGHAPGVSGNVHNPFGLAVAPPPMALTYDSYEVRWVRNHAICQCGTMQTLDPFVQLVGCTGLTTETVLVEGCEACWLNRVFSRLALPPPAAVFVPPDTAEDEQMAGIHVHLAPLRLALTWTLEALTTPRTPREIEEVVSRARDILAASVETSVRDLHAGVDSRG